MISAWHRCQPTTREQFHHVFFFGDLNYRLDFGNQVRLHVLLCPGSLNSSVQKNNKSPSAEQHAAMVAYIQEQVYSELFKVRASSAPALLTAP